MTETKNCRYCNQEFEITYLNKDNPYCSDKCRFRLESEEYWAGLPDEELWTEISRLAWENRILNIQKTNLLSYLRNTIVKNTADMLKVFGFEDD
ncbi:MAG: hypothetical protein KKD44_27250 [Proteobacteria bacterium]|nr:hypothetical protein [Pseudomonadota bacterium]